MAYRQFLRLVQSKVLRQKQSLEYLVSVFFNHLYHSEEVENEIELEDRIKSIPGVIAESYFKYRNFRPQEGCLNLENYSFELLL